MGLKEAGLRGSLRNVSEATPAFYDVQITGTNEPITEGDTLDVNYQVQNTGDQDGIKDVFLEIDTVEEDRDSNISLSGGATATGTLQWVTQNGEAGTYNAVVLSPDDSDSVSVSVGAGLPDSVVSRPNDDGFAELATQSGGAVVNFNGDFSQFGFNISNNTEGAARARLFDYSQGSYVLSVDISNKSAGDPVVFEYDVVGGVDYGIELDANGGSYQLGYLSSSLDSTYTSQDVDIVSVSVDGSQSSIDLHQNVNDIGSTGL